MATDPTSSEPKLEAVSVNTSPERLWELARVSTELARTIAKNPNAAPDLLRELGSSSDETTRSGVATNPNTPTDMLLNLGAQFPEQLLDNPVFGLLLLENPNLLADMPVTTLQSLLKQDVVPESFLEWAADNSDREVLLAVAANPNTPKSALSKLTQSGSSEVAEAARLHVNWAGEMNSGWDEAARAAIKTTRLKRSCDSEAFLWAIGAIPESFLLALLSDVRLEIAENPNTPSHILELLVGDRCESIRQAVAYHPNMPLPILQQFYTQYKATKTPETSSEILRELATSQWAAIRAGVAGHINTPNDVLEQLAGDLDIEEDEDFIEQEIAVTIDIDEHLYDDELDLEDNDTDIPHPTDRGSNTPIAVAKAPDTPASVLEQLAREQDVNIRQAVAQNPNIPLTLLEQLATDEDDCVRRIVAFHPKTPVSLMKQIAEDKYNGVRLDLARNLNTPSSILEQLAADRDGFVRLAVAIHPNTPVRLLKEMAKDRSFLRCGVAQNPNTPVDVLEHLAQDRDSSVREGVAKNPNTSVSILEQLTKNENYDVQKAIAENSNTPVSLLEQLARDGIDYVVRNTAIEKLKQYVAHNLKNLEIAAKWLTSNLERLPGSEYQSVREVVAQHPDTPVSMLEQIANRNFLYSSSIISYAGERLKQHILLNPDTSGSLIARMAKHKDTESEIVLVQIAENCNTPTKILEQLARTKNQHISETAAGTLRETVAKKPEIPGSVLQRLAEIKHRWLRQAVATHPNTPAITLVQLAEDEDYSVRNCVANNPNTPAIALVQLAEDEEYSVRMCVANNPNTPISILQKLATDEEYYVQNRAIKHLCENVACNFDIPGNILQKFLEIKDRRVGLLVARHPNTSAIALDQLALHQDKKVRLVVAKNPNTPAIALEKLVQDENTNVREAALTNSNIPISILEQFAPLKDPNTPPDTLAGLATSEWVVIREGVASHPHTTVSILEQLAKDRNIAVCLSVATNPNAPASLLEKLGGDREYDEVVMAVAQNPNTPITLLEQLAFRGGTTCNKILIAVIKNLISQNPDRAVALVERYTQYLKQPSFSRLLVFLHPQAPSSLLAKNFRSSSWLERYAIATNPNTPVTIRQRLTQDGNRVVRAAAEANLRQCSFV